MKIKNKVDLFDKWKISYLFFKKFLATLVYNSMSTLECWANKINKTLQRIFFKTIRTSLVQSKIPTFR